MKIGGLSCLAGWLLVGLVSIQAAAAQEAPATASRDLAVTVGKSVLVDSPAVIERVAVANGDVAEAVVITPREILINGRMVGETSLIVWQQGGNRLFFDVTVRRSDTRLDNIRRELAKELGTDDVTLDLEGDNVFLRGTVADMTQADRAVAIASTLGKAVNLLRVTIPGTDQQILLKVRFADVDRSAIQQLGVNFASTGAGNTAGTVSTQQFSPITATQINGGRINNFNLSDALNILLVRPDIDLSTTIKALQSRSLLQVLAEPNVLAINGHPASFLAGGEFPYPTLQGGGGGLGAVTIQFREFGIRLSFTPTMTPRGSIRLTVAPEVSSLDTANGLLFQGFTIPGINTRRVNTEVELEDGQSFAIAGLLDNRDTETFNRIPGLADIPFFGKLFRSKQITKNNSELLVLVTPELVRPIPVGAPRPDLNRPGSFLPPNTSSNAPRTPGVDVTGPVAAKAAQTMPVEQLIKSQGGQTPAPQQSQIQFVPVPLVPTPVNPPGAAQPAPQPTTPQPTTPPAPSKPDAGQR